VKSFVERTASTESAASSRTGVAGPAKESPSPSWPKSSQPQHCTLPSPPRPHAKSMPAATVSMLASCEPSAPLTTTGSAAVCVHALAGSSPEHGWPSPGPGGRNALDSPCPQHPTAPDDAARHALPSPNATSSTSPRLVSDGTIGVAVSSAGQLVPIVHPVSPVSPSPQQNSSPVWLTAQVLCAPAARETTLVSWPPPSSTTGCGDGWLLGHEAPQPSPSCPSDASPQQETSTPSGPVCVAQVCCAPAVSCSALEMLACTGLG